MKKRYGFTIVELIVVIVVIAILVSIVIVAYGNVQKRARDTIRKQDVETIAKAIEIYDSDNGPMYTSSGCGSSGNGSGWLNYSYPGYTSTMDCLVNAGAIKTSIEPVSGTQTCSNGDMSCGAYMKYTCVQSGHTVTYVLANLETLPHTTTAVDGTCNTLIDDYYGMNYYVKVTDR